MGKSNAPIQQVSWKNIVIPEAVRKKIKKRSRSAGFKRFSVVLAIGFLSIVIITSLFGEILAPYNYAKPDVEHKLAAPSFLPVDGKTFIFGTDQLGRDLLSRIIIATRTTVIVAISGAVFGAVAGIVLGLVSAHFRGWVENSIMLIVDVQSSLPYIIFAMAAIAVFGNALSVVIIVLSLSSWPQFARLTRGIVLSEKEKGYVTAARALGIPTGIIYLKHIMPNIVSILIIQFSISLPSMILLETSLSFLGLGVVYPMTSLGAILGGGRVYLMFAPWLAVIPGIIISLFTLSVSVLGNALRDRTNPES
ncbi:MAG: ABC transporter permease [Bacteroidetes bacterium]|nr:ABC transporter permease [Bacteroidota bacterium]